MMLVLRPHFELQDVGGTKKVLVKYGPAAQDLRTVKVGVHCSC